MRFFSEAEVARALPMARLIPAVASALQDLSAGRVQQPLRVVHELDPAHGTGLLFMKPVMTESLIVTKLITQLPGNSARGLPTMLATLVVMDRATGQTRAIMEATALTNRRTAAASAVAVDIAAPRAPITLALIGSGALARTHAEAIRAVREVSEIRVWSPTTANAKACADDVGGRARASVQAAVESADVIVTATLSATSIVHGAWVKPGAVVCAVGAPRPTWRELDDTLMQCAVVLAETYESARNEAGDILLSGATVYAEIGEVLAGSKNLPLDQTLVFKTLGQAVCDAAAAQLVLQSSS